MSAWVYQCTRCSPTVPGPLVSVCSSPVAFTHGSPQGSGFTRCSLGGWLLSEQL
jgi:hypothetical protein